MNYKCLNKLIVITTAKIDCINKRLNFKEHVYISLVGLS